MMEVLRCASAWWMKRLERWCLDCDWSACVLHASFQMLSSGSKGSRRQLGSLLKLNKIKQHKFLRPFAILCAVHVDLSCCSLTCSTLGATLGSSTAMKMSTRLGL